MPNVSKNFFSLNNKIDRSEYNTTESTVFYNSSKWRKLSILYRKLNPLCVESLAHGIISPADVVDHIIPIKFGGAKFNVKNLQGLSHAAHNSKSSKEKLKPMYAFRCLKNGEKIPIRDNSDKLVLSK